MILLSFLLALQTTSPAFRVIDKGSQSGIDDAKQVVVRTADDWAKLWRVHGMDRARPNVDFSRDTVVAIFMGSRPTAGFGVDIVGVTTENGATTVRYREQVPARDAITAQVLTSPYVVAVIPKAAGEVKFEKVE